MENGNNGFTFFKNYYTATNNMTDEQRLQFYDAIIEYGILNKEPKLDGLMLSAFELARTCIDKSIDIRERGRRGGIAKGKNYKEDESCYIAKTEVLNSKNESAKYEEKRIEENRREVEEEEKRKEVKKEKGRFTPPALDDVAAYCTERGNSIDPQRFIDFYQSKGWKVGSTPMKDWKAAVRNWERNNDDRGSNKERKGVRGSAGTGDRSVGTGKVPSWYKPLTSATALVEDAGSKDDA